MQAPGALRAGRGRDLHGHARRRAACARPRGGDRLGPVQVVPGRPRAHAGLPLAPARPDRDGREADRPRRGDEVPLVRRASPREARVARASVPPGVRARSHRARAVRRVCPGAGAAPAGAGARPRGARRGDAGIRHVEERGRQARALDRARGRGAATPGAGAAVPRRRARRLRALGQPPRSREARRHAARAPLPPSRRCGS